MNFWHELIESALGANKNWIRWWYSYEIDIVAVMLPEVTSWEIILENILCGRVFEWLVILGGCTMYGIKEFEARESKNLLGGWWSF